LRKLDPNTPAGKERIPALLQDAVAHGFEVKPPSLKHSRETWMPGKNSIVAGWTQIKGIGPAQSKAIEELREQTGGFSDWADLQKARGIGPKKIQEILAFTSKKDPFGLDYVASSTDEIIEDIRAGRMADCPEPDTVSKEIPYEAETSYHIVCVMLKKLIPKNLYEQHRIKNGGQELDRSTVKNPDLADYCTLHTQDVSGPITISVNRNIFPKYKEELESLRPGKDFLVVQAKKMNAYGKILLAQELWPIEMES
jgi:DNA polymerase III alpha subunit